MTEWTDQLHHNNASADSTALVQVFLAKHHITQVCQPPLQPWFGSMRLLAFPKAKIAVEREENCECDGHTVRKLSQRHLTAGWLASRDTNISRMHSKVYSDWLPSYIKAKRPVSEIFKMAWYFPDSPRMSSLSFKFSQTANLNEILIWYCFLTSSSLSFLRLNLSHQTSVLLAYSLPIFH